jgi:zinc transporter ZupT
MVFMVLAELLPQAYEHGERAQVATLATAAAAAMVLFQQWL